MFIRTYSLAFGATYSVTKSIGIFKTTADYDDYLNENQTQFYKIEGDITNDKTGLQIVFNIYKNSETKKNKHSQITVYNMPDKIVNYLQQNMKKNVVCSFKAGYADDGLKQIFKGLISNVTDVWEGTERKTTLLLTTGNFQLKEANSNRSYVKGTKVDTIVSDLLSDFGLPKATGKIVQFGSGETIKKPYLFTGLTSVAMKSWCERYKTNFSIQDGKVMYMPINGRTQNVVTIINEDSGLIGNIVPVNKDGQTLTGDTKAKGTVYKFKILLNGAITPEDTVKLDTDDYSDIYLKVIDVQHNGSYEDGSWCTTIQGKVVDNVYTSGTDYTG